MAKRKPEDPPAGSPAWMATFSDLMNLLFSKGQDKIKKYKSAYINCVLETHPFF